MNELIDIGYMKVKKYNFDLPSKKDRCVYTFLNIFIVIILWILKLFSIFIKTLDIICYYLRE